MVDIATLGYAVDTSGLKKGGDAVDEFTDKNRALAASQKELAGSSQAATTAVSTHTRGVATHTSAVAKWSDAEKKVFGSLVEQSLLMRIGARDLSIYNALKKAGSTIDSEAGREIATLAGRHYDLAQSMKGTSGHITEQRMKYRAMAEAARVASREVGGLVGEYGHLVVGSQHLSPALIAGTVAVAGIAAVVVKSIEAYVQFERHQATVANALRLTSSASLQNAASIEHMQERMAKAGTQSTTDIRAATVDLLKYRVVSGSAFEAAMKGAQDLANSGFVDLRTATHAIGKAFEDPINGLDGLRQAGLRITPTQEKMIADFARSGNVLEAYRQILKLVGDQAGGATARASDTLSASWGKVLASGEKTLEYWGKTIAGGNSLKSMLENLAAILDKLAGMKPVEIKVPTIDPKTPGLAPWLKTLLEGGSIPLPGFPSGWGTTRPSTGRPATSAIAPAPETPAKPDAAAAHEAATATAEYTKSLELLELQRDKAINQILKYQKMAAEPGNTFGKEDAEGAQRWGEQLTKVEAKIKAVKDAKAGATLVGADTGASEAAATATDKVTTALRTEAETARMTEHARQKYILTGEAMTRGNKAGADAIGNYIDKIAQMKLLGELSAQSIVQTSALQTQVETFGMAAGKAAELTFVNQKLAEAQARGIPVSDALRAAYQAQGAEIGSLTQRLERLNDVKQAANAAANAGVDALWDWATGAKSADQAIKDLTKSLSKMALQGLLAGSGPFAGLFGSKESGGIFGALLKALFSGFKVAHTGGVVGSDPFTTRYIHPAYFDDAPHFGKGGIAGLGPDEQPIIAHNDEEIVRKDDPRHRWNLRGGTTTGGRAASVQMHVMFQGPVGDKELIAAFDRSAQLAASRAIAAYDERLDDRLDDHHLLRR